MRKEMEGREGWTLLALNPGFRLWQRTEEAPAGRGFDGQAGRPPDLAWCDCARFRSIGQGGLVGTRWPKGVQRACR